MPTPKDPKRWPSVKFLMSLLWNPKVTNKYDEKQLKETIDNLLLNVPDFMPIEGNLFRAWLDISSLSLQNSDPNPGTALRYLDNANKCLKDMKPDSAAYIGYGIIIFACSMKLHEKTALKEEFKVSEDKFFELFQKGSSSTNMLQPRVQAYVDATYAFFLHTLSGKEHRCQSYNLFEKALRIYPGEVHWLFCKAQIHYRACSDERSISYNYPANYWKKPLSRLLEDNFKEVKATTESVLQIDPNFYWAKVYFAHVSLILDHRDTSYTTLIEETLKYNQKITDVALMACKIYKDKKDYAAIVKVLNNLDTKLKSSEVYKQLGIAFYELYKGEYKNQEYFNHALTNLSEAIKKDSCNFPALLKFAEIHARKAETDHSFKERAKRLYINVLSKCKDHPTDLYFAKKRATFNNVRHIFPPMQQVDNIYQCFLAIVKVDGAKHRDLDGQLVFSANFESYARRSLTQLKKIAIAEGDYNYGDEAIKLRAKVYLADCERIRGQLQAALSLYETINRDQLENTERNDVTIGLAKCHCGLKHFEEAATLANSATDSDTKNNILADIFTSEARHLQEKMLDDYKGVVVEMGSLEGCTEFFMANSNLQEDFFSVQKRTTQTLAQVKGCLDNAIRASQPKLNTKNVALAQKLTKFLETVSVQPYGRMKPPDCQVFIDTLNSLTNLRSSLLDFECTLLSDKATSMCSTKTESILCAEGRCAQKEVGHINWGQQCGEKAKAVLQSAIRLFNQSITCLQVTLLGERKQCNEQSPTFPIVRRSAEDATNEMTALSVELKTLLVSGCLQTMLASQFPNCVDPYIPSEMFDCLLKVQPKFDKNNIWLQVLSDVVNETTDNNILPEGVRKIFPDDDRSNKICTVHLARRGCEEAEKMVLTIIHQCAEFMENNRES